MILQAVANALPIAVGIAISPLAIVALMIILMTPRASRNAPAFLLGWLVGFLIVGVLASLIPGVENEPGDPKTLAGIVRIVLGLLMLALASRQWVKRPAAGQEPEVPSFFTRFIEMDAAHCALLGLLLSAVHPKNLPLIAAGTAAIGAYDLSLGATILAFSIFTILSSATILLPIAGYLLAAQRVATLFERWKVWLIRNNGIVVMLMLLLFGVLLISRGIKLLTA